MEEEELRDHLAKALVVMALGSNDYINNYLQPSFYTTSFVYNPKEFADLLITRYTRQILVRVPPISTCSWEILMKENYRFSYL